MNLLQTFNQKKTYQCPKCEEWFRLKLALLNHKCIEKPKRKNNG